MNTFKYSAATQGPLKQNPKHGFAMRHSMMLYRHNALYSFIPKNACSTLRLSTAVANGCVSGIEDGHWIHTNNGTFNASLGEALKVEYTFVILRCPFKRLASVYLDKFVAKEPDAWQYRNQLNRSIELDDLTFKQFVQSLSKPPIFNSNIHWRPQVDFLLFENYSDYFALESFSTAIEVLKDKIGLDVVDARELTNHGTDSFELRSDGYYGEHAAFDIAVMKRNGLCPSHESLYDSETYQLVSKLYKSDIELYTSKFSNAHLLVAPS